MNKSATLNLRVNPEVKHNAETVLASLGIPMSTAIEMYLRQISMTGGIPFDLKIPDQPVEIDAEVMTASQIHESIEEGLADIDKGAVIDVKKIPRKRR